MTENLTQSPVNPLPWIVWALALPIIAVEVVVQLGASGLAGGAEGIGWRMEAFQWLAFVPDLLRRAMQTGDWPLDTVWRLAGYGLVQPTLTSAVFVVVMTLALGKTVGEVFRWWAVALVFVGSTVLGAVVYTLALPTNQLALIGGFPAVYGLLGAFTFLLWVRQRAAGGNQWRAFSMIILFMLVQVAFSLFYGGLMWVAELAGFAAGFLMSFALVPGGWGKIRERLRGR